MLCEEGVLGGFAGFAGKPLCGSLLLNKVGRSSAILLKERLGSGCFRVGFEKFLRASFLAEHLYGLLLNKNCRNIDLHKPVFKKIMTS